MTIAVQNIPKIVHLHPYQLKAVTSPHRHNWHCWSRQTGKSFAMTLRRVMRAIQRKTRNQIILSASGPQSIEAMGKVRQHLDAIMTIFGVVLNIEEATLFAGTHLHQSICHVVSKRLGLDFKFYALAANPATLRGYTGDVFADEFAFHEHDDEIWKAIVPITMRGQGELDICSTPNGKANQFYRLRKNTMFAHSTVTLPEAVEQGLPIDVDETRRIVNDEYAWRQEYLCEFTDTTEAYMPFDLIAACEDEKIDTDWSDAKASLFASDDLYVGIDFGRTRDLTVIWIWGRPRGSSLLITRGVIELAKTPFPEQKRVIDSVMRHGNVRRACVDQTSMGESITDFLQETWGSSRVEGVKFNNTIKATMAGALRARAEDAAIRIPATDEVRDDWHSVKRVVTSAGNIRFDAERSEIGHADRFWAAALGVHAADDPVLPFEFTPLQRSRYAEVD